MQLKHKFYLGHPQKRNIESRKLINRLLFANFCKQHSDLFIHPNRLNLTDPNEEKIELSNNLALCSIV